MNIIQPSRKTRGCSWDGGECVFLNIDTGDCNLYDPIDWIKAKCARDLKMCDANYTAEEMLEKLGIKFTPSGVDPKHKILF
ncbi:hypothetical protein ACKUB1_13640 [Methanospirillum stamsii]|uniref:Uncharacterized protein n=1 Tax=Methanospirillum stamsii TaxID=1277351 RepID=A0A2V2NGW1_9EURY|nr:hypothetical protein [Methanospirillum stamsii]PWR74851.1 hypothetical protein DLD82_08105 [Methanospirillum stamsii]